MSERGNPVDKIDKYDWTQGVDAVVEYQLLHLVVAHRLHVSPCPHVDIVVVVIVVIVVVVIIIVVIVQVVVVCYGYHCHKNRRQECEQTEIFKISVIG